MAVNYDTDEWVDEFDRLAGGDDTESLPELPKLGDGETIAVFIGGEEGDEEEDA